MVQFANKVSNSHRFPYSQPKLTQPLGGKWKWKLYSFTEVPCLNLYVNATGIRKITYVAGKTVATISRHFPS